MFVFILTLLGMLSAKAEANIPEGSATVPIPRIIMIEPKTFPNVVTGYTSPYPTVVNVTIDHHIALEYFQIYLAALPFQTYKSH